MPHFITIPINENGIILDDQIGSIITQVMAKPFDFSDLIIYSHGWWTDANRALDHYNRFSVEFSRLLRIIAGSAGNPLKGVPASALGIGIHWPSMLSEDADSMENFAEALSFYTMEKRADTVGEHGLFSLLRMALSTRDATSPPLRIHWIGHSFGCKVVCSALQTLAEEMKGLPALTSIRFQVVLMQAAFDDNDLEAGDIYGDIANAFPDLRLLVTRSDEDLALQKWYPTAHMVNFFRPRAPRVALGARGPSLGTEALFGGGDTIAVTNATTAADIVPLKKRLVVADLTPLHQSLTDKPPAFVGRHSDIFHEGIYNLLAGFLFQ